MGDSFQKNLEKALYVLAKNSCFWSCLPICILKVPRCHFLKVLECKLVVILFDLICLNFMN